MRALVAIDLDEPREEVDAGIARVRSVLERLFATVDLLYVAPPFPPIREEPRDEEMKMLIEHAMTRMDGELTTRLTKILATWPAERRGAVEVVRGARSARDITDRAAAHDLLVVGTHGRRGLQRAWLGSVAELVVRWSPIPVLVIPGEVLPDKSRLLAAVDVHDRASAQIVAAARDVATLLRSPVDLVAVVVPRVGDLGRRERHDLERSLGELALSMPRELRGRVRIEQGDPDRSVADLARDHLLAVVGTHGRRGLERVLLGSVAEWIVRRCEVPVLVVPLVD